MTNFKINQINAALQHFFKITENEAYSDYFQDVCKIAVKALEKQIPKKPTPHTVEAGGVKIGNGIWKKGTTIHKCPSCNGFVTRFYRHCTKCGQALDWGQGE